MLHLLIESSKYKSMYHNSIKKLIYFSLILVIFSTTYNCKNDKVKSSNIKTTPKIEVPKGMVWVESKTFLQGAKNSDKYAMAREKPAHMVAVDGFYIDVTEVTNKQFKAFVSATDYVTIAERQIDWEEMKKELPPNTPKPHDSILQPGSLIFNKKVNAVVNMENYGQWWTWETGANWKHPEGSKSSIEGKDNYPVVHIAYEDAIAYCKWANRRLPTEAEWELAAQGTNSNTIFTWGNDPQLLNKRANTWQGTFPTVNEPIDGFKYIAPVKCIYEYKLDKNTFDKLIVDIEKTICITIDGDYANSQVKTEVVNKLLEYKENGSGKITLRNFLETDWENIKYIGFFNMMMLLFGYFGETGIMDNNKSVIIGFIFFILFKRLLETKK